MAGFEDRYGKDFIAEASESIREYLDCHGYPAIRQDRYKGDVRTWHICPCCGSGSGNNGHFTPAFNVYRGKNGGLRWGCFACSDGQKGGSIFDLAGYIEGVRTWPEKKAAIADFLGVGEAHVAARGAKRGASLREEKKPDVVVEESSEERRKRWGRNARYVKACMKRVHETDFFHQRGFTDEMIERFHLGYDPRSHAAVIPFLDERYHAVETYTKRNVLVGAGEREETWKHKNAPNSKKIIFNMAALANLEKQPVFIAEAPMDAMSIIQSGGEAIALGGTNNSNLFEIIDGFTNGFYDMKDLVFVLALDSDKAGVQGAEALAGEFDRRSIRWIKAGHPCFVSYHDPNEALMNDPDLLVDAVRYEVSRANNVEKLAELERVRPFEHNAQFVNLDLDREMERSRVIAGVSAESGVVCDLSQARREISGR